METKENIEAFNKRWNTHDEVEFQNEFQKFKNRIINIYRYADQKVTDRGAAHFCNTLGVEQDYPNRLNIINALKKEENHINFYFNVETLLNIPSHFFEYGIYCQYSEAAFQAIKSSNINLAIAEQDGRVILYPAGEHLLDKELVNKPLSFLPESSAQHFIDALRYCGTNQYCTSAEAIRRCVEEFLRVKLKNKQGFASNIKNLGIELKGEGGSSEIRNIIHHVFNCLEKYFNENSKHNSFVSAEDNEFLIYQAGLLMRYIDKTL